MEKINYIISLGCSCNVSYFIKKLSLKRFSLPFDWVFSNCKMIIDILYDNFEDFIDTKYIIGTSEHQKYHKKMFNHKNMTQQKNIEYYKRCITRFQQVINSNKKKLFIHTSYKILGNRTGYANFFSSPYDKHKLETNKDYIELYNCLKLITRNFILIIIIQIPYCKEPTILKEIIEPDLIIYNLHLKGDTSGTLFSNDIDNNNYKNIINSYNYELLNIPINSS
jgi:hypothetical protein